MQSPLILFDALDEFESSGEAFGKREEFSKLKQGGASTKKSTTMVPMPDHCYYSPQLRKLVEESDAEYLESTCTCRSTWHDMDTFNIQLGELCRGE